MILAACTHEKRHKYGKNKSGNQRYKCAACGAVFVEQKDGPLGSMRITTRQATTALNLFLEGMSVRSVERLTGICRQTLSDLVLLVGGNCQRLLDEKVKGVEAKEVAVDEIWSFNFCREKVRVARGYGEQFGDSWTFFAIERHNKMILAHKVGKRDTETCTTFLHQLRSATVGRFQLSSDGLAAYRHNVPFILGDRVDFGVIIKTYKSQQEVTRYAPAQIASIDRVPQFGNPVYDRISTSHIEVFNRQCRQSMKRFARLTNAHSKSLRHHIAMQAIWVAFYNFGRTHETIKQTPAMAAKLTDHKWTIRELLENAANC
jgi:transposase-like protein/IS1 family transposase